MFVQANGIQVHYAIDGPAAAPWVTLVTGIANDISLWTDQARALSEDFRVLRYDLRGQGRSESTAPPYSITSLGDDLISLWDVLGVRQSHLVGLGLGGAVSLGVALEQPSRLSSLVAACCRARMEPSFAQMWRRLADTVRKGGIEPIVEPTVQRWFSDEYKSAHPEVLDNVRAMIRSTSENGYLGLIDAFLSLDLEDRLPLITTRSLFLAGAEDRIGGPHELMQRLAAMVPGARCEAVAGAAHIANLQNPSGFNRHLQDFLAGR
jgi:3-oxoadipate enol-lactonase